MVYLDESHSYSLNLKNTKTIESFNYRMIIPFWGEGGSREIVMGVTYK